MPSRLIKITLIVLITFSNTVLLMGQGSPFPLMNKSNPAPGKDKGTAGNQWLSDSYISLSVGPAFPSGHYSSTSSGDWSGYSKLGFSVNLSVGITLYDDFGIAGSIGYFRNGYHVNEFLKGLLASGSLSGPYYGAYAHPYSNTCGMLGVVKAIPVGKKVWYDFHVLVGLLVTDYPNPQWYTSDTTSSIKWNININQTSVVCFDIGLDMRYLISPKYYFIGGFDFFYAEPSYSGTIEASSNGAQAAEIISGKLSISTITLNVGIAYKLW